ncbi:DNA-binding transcription factor [Lithospermum erythrorhizon]|uniref:DNA-binding transcription factor n=1 Tax=Lithospermum erythrorhizon TaxID=34254 RepID=A0AAV3QIX4_LITER
MANAPRRLNLTTQTSNIIHVNNFGGQVGQSSSENSESTLEATVNVGNVWFTKMEMEKIMADEKLTEISRSDPKRVKRVLRNRQSALRSKEKKLHCMSELKQKVDTMESESTTLSSQVMLLQDDNTMLTNHINELQYRIQAMEQHDHLQDALREALDTRVHQLRHAT